MIGDDLCALYKLFKYKKNLLPSQNRRYLTKLRARDLSRLLDEISWNLIPTRKEKTNDEEEEEEEESENWVDETVSQSSERGREVWSTSRKERRKRANDEFRKEIAIGVWWKKCNVLNSVDYMITWLQCRSCEEKSNLRSPTSLAHCSLNRSTKNKKN